MDGWLLGCSLCGKLKYNTPFRQLKYFTSWLKNFCLNLILIYVKIFAYKLSYKIKCYVIGKRFARGPLMRGLTSSFRHGRQWTSTHYMLYSSQTRISSRYDWARLDNKCPFQSEQLRFSVTDGTFPGRAHNLANSFSDLQFGLVWLWC